MNVNYKYIFIIILNFFCFCSSQNNRGYIVNIGDKSPEFNLEGKNFIESNKGKVIMLQFTASWCSVCIKEMPHIEKDIWEVYKNNEDFVLVALAKDTKKRPQGDLEIKQMIDRTNVTYPVIRDYDSKIFNLFADEKAGVTRNVIIDKKGNINFLTRLFDIDEFNEMKIKIRELLKE